MNVQKVHAQKLVNSYINFNHGNQKMDIHKEYYKRKERKHYILWSVQDIFGRYGAGCWENASRSQYTCLDPVSVALDSNTES